jgi:hypothetical protein
LLLFDQIKYPCSPQFFFSQFFFFLDILASVHTCNQVSHHDPTVTPLPPTPMILHAPPIEHVCAMPILEPRSTIFYHPPPPTHHTLVSTGLLSSPYTIPHPRMVLTCRLQHVAPCEATTTVDRWASCIFGHKSSFWLTSLKHMPPFWLLMTQRSVVLSASNYQAQPLSKFAENYGFRLTSPPLCPLVVNRGIF